MRYASPFAVWFLSSLILGVVHGPVMGASLGVAIAAGYLFAVRRPVVLARWLQRLQQSREGRHNSPEPTPYN